MCIIKAFNEIVASLLTVRAPWLNREWLIEVVLMAVLFVGSLNDAFDGVGGGERPEDKGSQEGQL